MICTWSRSGLVVAGGEDVDVETERAFFEALLTECRVRYCLHDRAAVYEMPVAVEFRRRGYDMTSMRLSIRKAAHTVAEDALRVRPRRFLKAKYGEATLSWGFLEDCEDIVTSTGEGTNGRPDRSFVLHLFTSPRPFFDRNALFEVDYAPSALDELVARGYDKKSLRFKIAQYETMPRPSTDGALASR